MATFLSHCRRHVAQFAILLSTAAACLASADAGAADVITTFNLSGVSFSDGGGAAGSFQYDSTTLSLSNVAITTSGGTLPGASYNDADVGGNNVGIGPQVFPGLGTVDIVQFEFDKLAEFNPVLLLDFAVSSFSLTSPDSMLIDLANLPFVDPGISGEFTCGTDCPGNFLENAADFRFITAGQIDPVPEPASLALLGSGIAGLGLASARRRGRKAAPDQFRKHCRAV